MAIIMESVEVKRPVDEVFAYTTDARKWPEWQPFPDSEQTSQGPVGVGTTFKGNIRLMGRTMAWTAKVTEFELNKEYMKVIISGPITNEQHNTYESIEGGTRFTIQYDVKVGGFMKLFSSMMLGALRKSLTKALGSLKSVLEAQA